MFLVIWVVCLCLVDCYGLGVGDGVICCFGVYFGGCEEVFGYVLLGYFGEWFVYYY